MVRLRGISQRLAPLVVGAFIAMGLLIAPTPHNVRAEPLPAYPTIYTEPFCFTTGGPQTVTLKGRNFEPNAGLTIVQFGTFDAQPPTINVTTDAYGVFVADIFVSVGYTTYGIRLDAFYDTNNESTVTSAFVNGCGSDAQVVATPNCGDTDNPTIHVTGARFGGPDVAGDITVELRQGDVTVGESLVIGASETFDVRWQPGVTLDRDEYTVVANQYASSYSGTWFGYDTFLVPCPQVTVDPTCVQQAGGPPDRMSIFVTGISGWQKGTADGYDEIQIVFDPDGEPQEFFFSANPYESEPGIGDDGSFAALEINPFARPDGTYTIQIKQQGYGADPIVDVVTTFTVPCSTPTIEFGPLCGPPELVGDEKRRYSLGVVGFDFLPNEEVTVVFDPDFAAGSDYPPETFTSVVDSGGTFKLDIDAAYRPPGAYRIWAYQVTRAGSYEASALFAVPCEPPPTPTLTLDPTCGSVASGLPLAYTINLTGTGFVPGRVDLVFDSAGLTPETATTVADDTGTFTFPMQVTGRPPGAYLVVASQTTVAGLLDQVSVPFLVACEGVLLRITPTAGARGFVPYVEGFNFPPSAKLLLHWDYGIGASQPIAVETDENGTFTRQVLIYRSDFMGLRHLTVELPSDPLAYADVIVPYLVMAGTVSPPFFTDNPFGPPDPIVLRR